MFTIWLHLKWDLAYKNWNKHLKHATPLLTRLLIGNMKGNYIGLKVNHSFTSLEQDYFKKGVC